jgi:hypothetical protein
MDSIIKRVLKDEWPSIQNDIEKMAADKVKARIEDKKLDVLANLNGVDVDKMREIAMVSKDVATEVTSDDKLETVPVSKE